MMRDVVAAAILDDPARPSRVLAARRSRPTELAGRWEFPGGKVEPDETCEHALVRELAEELGVTVELGAELADGTPWLISAQWRLRVWIAVITSHRPVPGDSHDELRWLARHELDAVDWLDADRPVVDRLAAILAESRGPQDARTRQNG